MKVKYKGVVFVCDWAVCHDSKVIFGTRSKEVFFIECGSTRSAQATLDELCLYGRVKANELGVVRCFYIDKMSDLFCENIFENAVFNLISGE